MVPLALFPFTKTATGEDDEEAEGRDYSQLPGWPRSWAELARFPKRFESFFDDQFPLRLLLVKLSSTVRFHVFGVSPTPAVLIGQDGWFFDGVAKERVQSTTMQLRDHFADHIGAMRYSDATLAQWARVLEERRVVLAAQGVKYLFAVAPAKRMIYPEYLPAAHQELKRETRLEQLDPYLARHSRVPTVDLRQVLLEAKKVPDRPLLFYKTDSHWNYYGAFLAYQALVEGVNRSFSDAFGPPLELDDFRIEYDRDWAHRRFTALMGQRVTEPYVKLVARDDNPLARLRFDPGPPFRQLRPGQAKRRSQSFARDGLGGILDWPKVRYKDTHYRRVEGVPEAKVRRLFVLGDSFIEKAFYLFAAHAREVYGYREVLDFPIDLVDQLAPEVVVHVIVQSFILRDTPKNPDRLTQAYLRIEHGRSERTLFESSPGAVGRDPRGQATLTIPPLAAPGPEPVVIEVLGSGESALWFEPPSGARVAKRRPQSAAPQYLELSPAVARAGGSVVIDTEPAAVDGLRVKIRQLAP
jgi:hypothetical protein